MKIRSKRFANAVVITSSGRLDHENSSAFGNGINPILEDAASSKSGIVLDFSELEYISSAGLRALMLAANQAKSHGVKIVVASLQPVVSEIFQISRFNMVFSIFGTVRDGLSAISGDAAAAFDKG